MNPCSLTSSEVLEKLEFELSFFTKPPVGALISYLSSKANGDMKVSSDFLFSFFYYFLADFSFYCNSIKISSISSNFLAISSSGVWNPIFLLLLMVYFFAMVYFFISRFYFYLSEFNNFLLDPLIISSAFFSKWNELVNELPNFIKLRRISIYFGFSTFRFFGIYNMVYFS